MRVLLINSVCGIGSTGKICAGIAEQFEKEGHEVKIAFGRDGNVPEKYQRFAVRIGTDLDVKIHGFRTRLFDDHCFASVNATRNFLKWAETYDPDLLWLHNIHGYYLNMELLFSWIKCRPHMKVKWTFHDCWPFTGHCTYFTMANCDAWKTGCQNCPQKREYPSSMGLDRSKQNYARKKELFTGVTDLTIITPSQWLANLVKQSFLKEYPVEVHYNTIDTAVFKPTPSDFRKRNGLENKIVVLGVASPWSARKGIQDFIKLAELLDERYAIVMVGLSQQQIEVLPKRIIGISRTNNATELAQKYTASDVFFNPTYEDNYPTVNLEAEACGTPVITYNVGGSAETLRRPDSVAVSVGDLEEVLKALQQVD